MSLKVSSGSEPITLATTFAGESSDRAILPILVVAPLLAAETGSGAEIVIRDVIRGLSEDKAFAVEVWTTLAAAGFDPVCLPERAFLDDFAMQFPRARLRVFPANTTAVKRLAWFRKRLHRGSRNPMTEALGVRGCLCGVGMQAALRARKNGFGAIYLPILNYGSTLLLAATRPERTILHPFAHDEPIIRARAAQRALKNSRMLLFNSNSEADVLANAGIQVAGRGRTIGNPVPRPNGPPDHTVLKRLGIGEDDFVLYLGRVTKGKNIDQLLGWHVAAKPTSWLVLAGRMASNIGDSLRDARADRIIVAGPVSEAEKWALMERAVAVVQPSLLESFSLVMMEAWWAERPVIVHPASSSVVEHAERACGALFADSAGSYKTALARLRDDPALREQLGRAGRRYVEKNFTPALFEERLKSAFTMFVQSQNEFTDRVVG